MYCALCKDSVDFQFGLAKNRTLFVRKPVRI